MGACALCCPRRHKTSDLPLTAEPPTLVKSPTRRQGRKPPSEKTSPPPAGKRRLHHRSPSNASVSWDSGDEGFLDPPKPVVVTIDPPEPDLMPTPEELVTDFGNVELASQPYADELLLRGRDFKSEAEIIFRSRCTAEAFADALAAVEALPSPDAKLLEALRKLPPLLEGIVYDRYRWNAEVAKPCQAALDRIAASSGGVEITYLRDVLLSVKSLWLEARAPRHDFYLCLFDEMVDLYSEGERAAGSVSMESLLMMHCIDMPVQQKKADHRRDVAAEFFKRMYKLNIAGHEEWTMQTVLEEHGTENELREFSMLPPMLTFGLHYTDPSLRCFVVMEGNARLASLNAALDTARETFPGFVAPKLEVLAIPFNGPELVQNNLAFLLNLMWRCSFPDVHLPGWRPQVDRSARPMSPEVVQACPRYFGYSPTRPADRRQSEKSFVSGTPSICKAAMASGVGGG
eukprot:TRINITY_DN26175_c0_g2_i1.p1 TRINITY_DN26175_c0_g2~~TRINITY_DN26175_c0_g2_i1.p1  ORF type:complete len:459 (-),score=99.66 TRINITY_DN26175_c0_g2_i1:565-1941(-)